ncbi:MAG TPA: electron transfer flavoprotein subunit alpha/FixB family protein [Candidatus Lambdaproteobacteria bacterium]|jgi:electron transfer flavoprotein alpha subunit|uniref:Electron transfer flavoprotein subunit alpha/FixB family protein n=1 Tax=SAR324 cluster bacterium TaxID=2024889 RepID=A0A432GVU4_9DELT|nr:MAG: electron transfer flavoprotein subunit alpha/FixB family protein [SAR324 cluster bacterium]HCB33079.1 electron transfer flavoprotein subunit alpha/FixB family protein [Deltaproteobacteria bacterium]HIA34909.1 electron transfer flavoprotein subunit alpha/FixB family protein [Candidatus Lambdaproteobacteria bacterium]HIB15184.1 electron transfer flavoprotein subunit alpha/FixB family protein [Candidatus Lambdaproteobacteria bacterium]HIB39768.1 electron transfer flavoprotein subunit alpha
MSKILIVAEVKNGEIKKNTLELLSFAKSQGLENEAVLIGSGVSGQADILAGQGASTVYLGDDPSLEIYNTEQYTALVSDAILQSGATQVWLSSSELGRDLTPRVAARQSVGALSDVTQLEVSGDEITAYRPCMSTKVIQKCKFSKDGLRVISIRSGFFTADETSPATAKTVSLSIPEGHSKLKVKEVQVEVSDEVELNEARIVVSAGRGVGGTEGCDFVKPLATDLGAAFGASRAVCDAGWLPHKHQVGQTGTMVTPDFYFALGISGAIQHLAGMSGSKVIIAVNKDPDAPIFKVADYGIVGDLFKAVPVLREEVQKLKA